MAKIRGLQVYGDPDEISVIVEKLQQDKQLWTPAEVFKYERSKKTPKPVPSNSELVKRALVYYFKVRENEEKKRRDTIK